jgi:hypothetical protein
LTTIPEGLGNLTSLRGIDFVGIFQLDNITQGISKFDFLDTCEFETMSEFDNITRGTWTPYFFDED